MLINVSTRRFGRAVRLPEGDVPAPPGSGVSKSAASRRFVALSAARLADFMATDLSALDLLVVQIDGLHLGDDLVLVAAIGVDGEGNKHPLALVEGATENAATVQALLDNLVSRGLDPTVPRLFIVDGAKALSKAIRRTFGSAAAIQRCQIHKARNIMERLPKEHHAASRRVLRQGWELDDADKAEKIDPQFRASTRPAMARRSGQHPRRPRRNPDCSPVEAAEGTSSIARLHQHRREHDGHHSPRHAQRQKLAGCPHGLAMGRGRHDRGQQALLTLKAHKQLSALRAALQAHHDRRQSSQLPT